MAIAALLTALVVVTGAKSSLPEMSTDEVRGLYLGKGSDHSAQTLDQPTDAVVRVEFVKKVLNKTEKQLSAYWAQQIFTGRGTPPRILAGDLAVKAWIAANPNAVGYIAPESLDPTLKVILQVP